MATNKELYEDGCKPLLTYNVGYSAQPCGCDPGLKRAGKVVGHICEFHRGLLNMPSKQEVRVVDPTTGGEKGSKLARFSLIPYDFLWALAEHYGRGAKKYADRNWERGYNWSLTLDAMQRHLAAWIQGEDDDPETGSSHLIAVAWHVIALWWFHRHRKGTDDIRSNRV